MNKNELLKKIKEIKPNLEINNWFNDLKLFIPLKVFNCDFNVEH